MREAIERAKAAGMSTARWRMPVPDGVNPPESAEDWAEAHAETAERARSELATKENPLTDNPR